MLNGDLLSQWLQRRVGTVVYGPTAQLSPSGLLRISDQPDSHRVQIAVPVVHGRQAAVARAVVEGATGALAVRVHAVSSQAQQARQMERLVSMLTVAQAARAEPGVFPAVAPLLESFVVTAPGDEVAITSPDAQYELWCDILAWCPSNLAEHQQQLGAAAHVPNLVVTRILPVVASVHAVHTKLNIIHRNITPDNVLVDPGGRLLLTDWGVAHTIGADQTSTHTELAGNREFSPPPEALAGDSAVGRYTDAWYLGSLLVWMLTGLPPRTHQGSLWLPPGMPGGSAGTYLDELVRGLCHPDPRQRMNLADATTRLQHLTGATAAGWTGPAPVRPAVAPVGAPGPAPAVVAPTPAPVLAQLPDAPAVPGTAPDAGRRRLSRPAVAVIAALALAVVALGTTLVWVVTRPAPAVVAPTSMPPAPPPTPTPTPDPCWIDTPQKCPEFDGSMVAYYVYKGFYNGDPPLCYPEHTKEEAQFFTCGWEEIGVWVRIGWFSDMEAATSTYLSWGLEKTDNPPPFYSGPDGQSFVGQEAGRDRAVYCFADLPICLEAASTADLSIQDATDYFHAIGSADAHRIAEFLANQ
ncbi:MAG: hypothetical protein FWF02_13960 [Micrococcales bacterium]|nr:hypothetical protein [Micrococcales bacterium]MCL2668781.1 hypothetical protein [Micrococcales bacterium]